MALQASLLGAASHASTPHVGDVKLTRAPAGSPQVVVAALNVIEPLIGGAVLSTGPLIRNTLTGGGAGGRQTHISWQWRHILLPVQAAAAEQERL